MPICAHLCLSALVSASVIGNEAFCFKYFLCPPYINYSSNSGQSRPSGIQGHTSEDSSLVIMADIKNDFLGRIPEAKFQLVLRAPFHLPPRMKDMVMDIILGVFLTLTIIRLATHCSAFNPGQNAPSNVLA
ncbi:uncharacterized protein F5891DRAFT_977073 [Suillus fuscotomentosus]|uniref:Uncharacterized protein n=1 Tax=Suillus fuscotomentosus TaxID=1912939 RepID=A0AAD4EDR3_9AGAM|nr:uncharacterized protein F5891DRAFT_977073 [Suillus fuscotomentosus]KAG1904186.1 hypothetical protein F5891DRAFT_977073 [Suillus fuscotomentosus]